MTNRFPKRAFTLIELLVVIAIIAILAAILFPVFAQARAKARQATCTSNEKQIALGLLQYVQDYDESFPTCLITTNSSGDVFDTSAANFGKADAPWGVWQHRHMDWNKVCNPYVKSVAIYRCPDVDDGNDYTVSGKWDSDWTGSSNFALNTNLSGRGAGKDASGNTIDTDAAKQADLSFASSTILLSETGRNTTTGATSGLDGHEWGWTGDHKTRLLSGDSTAPPANSGGDTNQIGHAALQRHGGGADYAFADGHVKWFNAHAMGLKPDNTTDDATVDALLGTHDGSKVTYYAH